MRCWIWRLELKPKIKYILSTLRRKGYRRLSLPNFKIQSNLIYFAEQNDSITHSQFSCAERSSAVCFDSLNSSSNSYFIFLCEYIYDRIMFYFWKRTCLSFTFRPIATRRETWKWTKISASLPQQTIYRNCRKLLWKAFSDFVQALIKLDRLHRPSYFFTTPIVQRWVCWVIESHFQLGV